MKRLLIITACMLALSIGKAQTTSIIKFDQVQQILSSQNDTTYVLNFWATWCVPCVKEFPSFQALAAKHKGENVKVVMVSLDFKKDFDKSLKPFVAKHPIDAAVCLLDEPDYNSWIDKVDATWGGEIPVTLIVNGSKKQHEFFARDFTPTELEQTFTKTKKQ